MIPVYQRHLRGPSAGDDPPAGDCFAACLASILELPLEAVPNWGDDRTPEVAAELEGPEAHRWWTACRRWLREEVHRPMGRPVALDIGALAEPLEAVRWPADPRYRYAIASIPSPRGRWHHVVVCDEHGVVVHDPYPDATHALGRTLEELNAAEVLILVDPYDPFPPVYDAQEAAGG